MAKDSGHKGSGGLTEFFSISVLLGAIGVGANYYHDNYLDEDAKNEKAMQEFRRGGAEFNYKIHEEEIARLNVKLGDDIAAQCKNVAEERYDLMAGENADKYKFILSQQMGCLRIEERKADQAFEM